MATKKKAGVLIEETSVTAAMAAEWLKNNAGNRALRKATVRAYARDMKAGRWELTHQGIAFDTEGRLLDGQHRLAAVVEADVTVQMLVTRNLERKSSLVVLDTGIPRTAADNGKILYGFTNVNERYAMGRGVLMLEHEDPAGSKFTRFEHDEAVIRHEEGINFVLSRSPHLRPTGSFGAAFAYAYPVQRQRLTAFCEGLISMVNLPDRSPILACLAARERLPPQGANRYQLMIKVLRCLEAFCKDQPLERAIANESGLLFFKNLRKKLKAG